MHRQAKIRVLGAVVAGIAAVSVSALSAGAGSAASAPVAQPVHGAAADASVVHVAQAATTPAPAATPAEPVSKPVSYTASQVDRGKKLFDNDCVDCHGEDLRGGVNGGPPLVGLAFEGKYFGGAPASAMFLFMSTQMPPNDPGGYSPDTYAELMAYILDMNGLQAGNTPLPSDLDALDYLTVEK